MASASILVVGVAVKYSDDEASGDEPYIFDPARSLDDVTAGTLEKDYPQLRNYGAGYENHFSGPGSVLGVAIFETWNDAIELTSQIQAQIDQAILAVREATGKEPSLFFIGGQT